MIQKIKTIGSLLTISLLLASCGGTYQIQEGGRLTLISTKNIAVKEDFVLLSRNAGFDESQISVLEGKGNKKAKKQILANMQNLLSDEVPGAINNVVEGTPGGLFMENAEIYLVKTKKSGRDSRRNTSKRRGRQKVIDIGFIASGDVYGIAGQQKQIRGYIVGSKALYKKQVGTVVTLIDDQYCLWKSDDKDKYEKVLYDELLKIGE